MSAEAAATEVLVTSLACALLFMAISFFVAIRWLRPLSMSARAAAVVAIAVAALLLYGTALHVVVNWDLLAGGFGGVWIDPSWISKLFPVGGAIIGAVVGVHSKIGAESRSGAA